MASNGDKQYIHIMAVPKSADKRPTRECSDADVRRKVFDHTPHKLVPMGWIPSHRHEFEARNAHIR